MFGKNFFLFLLLFCTNITLFAEDNLRHYVLKNADILKIDQTANERITTLTGDVHLIYDNIEFFADNAQIFQNQKKIKLTGNVKAIDDTLETGAQKAKYFGDTKKLFLEKQAYFIENSKEKKLRKVTANKINYNRNEKIVIAEKNATAEDFTEDMILCANYIKYDLGAGCGVARQNPELIFLRDDTLKISSKQMEFFTNKKKFTATYDVKIETKDTQTQSNFLLYFENMEKAILLGRPEFYSKTTDAFANEFHIYFKNENIEKLVLINNSEMHFKNKNQDNKINYLFAKNIQLHLKNEKINYIYAIDVEESCIEQSQTEEEDFFKNKLTTKELEVFFNVKEEVEKVIAKDEISGRYSFHKNIKVKK